ncbi:hypothetical protein E4U46_004738 [Claviceps purpurea]|nr:hypothetical protein E4U46_004738 [Claviceps purpurea]
MGATVKSTGSPLEVHWKSTGSLLEVHWKSTGSPLASPLEVDWKSTGHKSLVFSMTSQTARQTAARSRAGY